MRPRQMFITLLGTTLFAALCLFAGHATGEHRLFYSAAWGFFIGPPATCALLASLLGVIRQRERLAQAESERIRRRLDDCALAVLAALLEVEPQRCSFPYELKEHLHETEIEPDSVRAALSQLVAAGLAQRIVGGVGGQPVVTYRVGDPQAGAWLAGERIRRERLLEQSPPSPGPRGRQSALAG